MLVLTKPALERLIGGDSELEVKLRHAAANAFCKQHLKEILNAVEWQGLQDYAAKVVERVQANIKASIEAAIKPLLESHIGTGDWLRHRIKLSPAANEAINTAIAAKLEQDVQAKIQHGLESVRVRVEQAFATYERNLAQSIDQRVQAAIATQVDVRVQEILETAMRTTQTLATRERSVDLRQPATEGGNG